MASNPDPALKLTSAKGAIHTLDDWCTTFQLFLAVLPARAESSVFVPIARRIFATLGDADCRCAFLVTGPESVAARILGDAAEETVVFVDPEQELVQGLGLERLPALVHLRQDTSLASSTEGWDPTAWQHVTDEVAKAMAWTSPVVARPDDPAPFPGWPVA